MSKKRAAYLFATRFVVTSGIYIAFNALMHNSPSLFGNMFFVVLTILWQGAAVYKEYQRESYKTAVARKYLAYERREKDWRNAKGDIEVDYPIKRKRGG